MKNSKEINDLPIINISNGDQLGRVKSIVINPDKGSVDFLTIEHEDWQVSIKAIPFKKVVGIGEYALTIESDNAIIDLNEIPIANQLVNKKIKIIDTKVMTRKGELIGDVNEYFVDENNGDILGLQLKIANNQVFLSADHVVTYGKDIIIVKEESSSNFCEELNQLDGKEEIPVAAPKFDQELTTLLEEFEVENSDLKDLKLKQVELLQGKTLINDVYGKSGAVLFRAGTVLTEKDITRAQEEGPGIIVDLSMNVEV